MGGERRWGRRERRERGEKRSVEGYRRVEEERKGGRERKGEARKRGGELGLYEPLTKDFPLPGQRETGADSSSCQSVLIATILLAFSVPLLNRAGHGRKLAFNPLLTCLGSPLCLWPWRGASSSTHSQSSGSKVAGRCSPARRA